MTKFVFFCGMTLALCIQSANAATNCLPTNTNPSNQQLLAAISCLQEALNKIPPPPTTATDPNAIHVNDAVGLQAFSRGQCATYQDVSAAIIARPCGADLANEFDVWTVQRRTTHPLPTATTQPAPQPKPNPPPQGDPPGQKPGPVDHNP